MDTRILARICIVCTLSAVAYASAFQWLSLGMAGTSIYHSEPHAHRINEHRTRSLPTPPEVNKTQNYQNDQVFTSDFYDNDDDDDDVSDRPSYPHELTTKYHFRKSQCKLLTGLSKKQIRVCRRDFQHMDSVRSGAYLALMECQWQFRQRRWNCTPIDSINIFGSSLVNDTREAAFVNAIATAGVAQQVTRDCSMGLVDKCGCDQSPQLRGTSAGGFRWAGCSDNIHYGVAFTRRFVDAAERAKAQPMERTLINLHNIEAGRQAVAQYMRLQCKCHGVSGSCTVKSCYNKMPTFREVGDILKERFDSAAQVRLVRSIDGLKSELVPKNPMFKSPSRLDLVYSEESPDYCKQIDPTTKLPATQGRLCNATSSGIDGCDLLCCNRGYSIEAVSIVDTQCNCKFVFCCEVKCETCIRQEYRYTCR